MREQVLEQVGHPEQTHAPTHLLAQRDRLLQLDAPLDTVTPGRPTRLHDRKPADRQAAGVFLTNRVLVAPGVVIAGRSGEDVDVPATRRKTVSGLPRHRLTATDVSDAV